MGIVAVWSGLYECESIYQRYSGATKGNVGMPYVAQREDTVGFWPLGYDTVRGFRTMPPPQARPTQPRELDATTWRTMS